MASQFTINKILAGAARFFSSVLSPLLMPTYGTILVLWTSVLCALPNGTRITVVMVMMGITCALPMICISVLHHYGIIRDKRLEKPKERYIPYAFATICYVAAAAYLNHIHSPLWFTMFAVGGMASLVITMVVNFKWKTSAHMTGMGGVVALLYQIHVQGLSAFNLFGVLCIAILLAGVVGTSRLILKCHTVLQVILGFLNGYICVTIAMKLIE